MAPILKLKPHLRPAMLHNGDCMSQAEFHRAYSLSPEGFRAELVGGTVLVASPMLADHGEFHSPLMTLFGNHESETAGVTSGDNSTLILGDRSEPQPDAYLRILPEFGGQAKVNENGYIEGPPGLIAEIALSSYSVDLHSKREDYAENGVHEYLVLSIRERRLHWFDLPKNVEHDLPSDGVCRLRSFPGLWIHVPSLIARDLKKLNRTLRKGIRSPAHAAFVRKLAATKRRHLPTDQ